MVPVQENMAKLKPEDRAAIAAFLKSLPPLPDAVPRKNKATDKSEEDDGEPADVAGAYVARPLSAASSALQGKGAKPGACIERSQAQGMRWRRRWYGVRQCASEANALICGVSSRKPLYKPGQIAYVTAPLLAFAQGSN